MRREKTPKQKNKKGLKLDLPVLDLKGKRIDTVSLNNKIFDGKINIPLIHQVVTMYEANRRFGCASCKTRAEVRGGGKKPWRQKGTGRARTGSIRNPLWRSGGIIFGPHPRNFSYRLPQRTRKAALRSSLNSKLEEEHLLIINEIKLDQPKTKELKNFLKSVGVKENESACIVVDKIDRNIRLASRNIPNVCVRISSSLNTLDVLKNKKALIQKSALQALTKGLAE